MKKISIVYFLYLVMFALPAFSMGFGMYGTTGYGKVDILTLIEHQTNYRVDYSLQNFLYGGGILLESGNESEGYHNRFNMGFDGSTVYVKGYSYRRFIRAKFENVFAFRVAGTDQVRFWIGPLLGLYFLSGLTTTQRSDQWTYNKVKSSLVALAWGSGSVAFRDFGLYYIYGDEVWKRVFGVFIPLGIAMGTNIRLGESATLTVEGGFRCGLYHLRKVGINYEGYINAGFIFGVI